MIYFDYSLHQNIIDEHYLSLKTYLEQKIDETTLNSQLKKYIEDHLEEIVKSKPQELKKINEDFKALSKYKESLKKKISKIFNYEYFAKKSENRYDAYDLAKKLNVRTCLYCNRNYCLTVMIGRRSRDKFTRPEFDHFFDKGDNPLLSLSIYNLLPSCKTCNSSLKGKKKFNLTNYVHPYIDNVINFYTYRFVPHDVPSILGGTSNLSIEITVASGDINLDKKIKTSKKLFRLEEIMSAHSEEIKDLFDIKHRFSERYFEELFKTYSTLGLNYEDVYRVVFGVHYQENNFSNRPFSKLKKDILIELGIIT